MFVKTALIAVLAAVAAAIDPTTQWATDNPTSKPGLGENVQAGVPYEVKWQATTPNKLSIWLYKGPSTNVLPQFVLAAGVPNTGSATITIPKTVENSPNSGYGLQLRDDVTGQYQWTPQFGVVGAGETTVSSTPAVVPSAPVSSSSTTRPAGGYPTVAPPSSKPASSSPVASATKNSTSPVYSATVVSSFVTLPTGSAPTAGNTTVIASRTPTVSTLLPSSTTGGIVQSTGAAGALKAGAALAAGVAGLVAALV